MCKYFRNHYSYSFLYLILYIEDFFPPSFRIQVNLDVWSRSIIRKSISSYSYPTSFYWRGLNLHLLIRAICLQCWHEKWSLSRVSTSYKENNPLKIPSESLTFIFLIPFLLEFSSKSVLSVDRERWICFTPDPTQPVRLRAHFPAPCHATQRKVLWFPQNWAPSESKAEDQVGCVVGTFPYWAQPIRCSG